MREVFYNNLVEKLSWYRRASGTDRSGGWRAGQSKSDARVETGLPLSQIVAEGRNARTTKFSKARRNHCNRLCQVTATTSLAELLLTVADPTLTEDASSWHSSIDPSCPVEVIERLAKNANVLKSRKVKIALASHPHAPRQVSVPLARQLHTFDLDEGLPCRPVSSAGRWQDCGRRRSHLTP